MFGKAYFIDGHIESIAHYQWNPQGTELYFAAASGFYGYIKHHEPKYFEMACERKIFSVPYHTFYKYSTDVSKWLPTTEIEHIEIFTEVLHDA